MRYSMLYVCITFAVLLFLNLYCSKITQQMIRQGKESSLMEKALFAASEISGNDAVVVLEYASEDESGGLKTKIDTISLRKVHGKWLMYRTVTQNK